MQENFDKLKKELKYFKNNKNKHVTKVKITKGSMKKR